MAQYSACLLAKACLEPLWMQTPVKSFLQHYIASNFRQRDSSISGDHFPIVG